jgi:photosystem II stability/assembly factor-like uncharacterized protein
LASAAASDNGSGSFAEIYHSGAWTKKAIQAGMLLDNAVTPSGNVVATSLWGVFQSNGDSFVTVDGISGTSQSANIYGQNKENFALVGTWAVADPNGGKKPTYVSGVASSTDGGKTWSISADVPPGYARYGAFPSDSTWYVSSGIWGNDPAEKLAGHQLSSRFTRTAKGVTVTEKPSLRKVSKGLNDSTTGWFGAVSKTTDGGKTWTQVFSTDLEADFLYFNGISCGSELNCIVVAEGDDASGGYKTVAYSTFDGGKTWEANLVTTDVGLMQVKFVNDKEAWLAGTGKSGRSIVGQFYRTTDGGKTYTLVQVCLRSL